MQFEAVFCTGRQGDLVADIQRFRTTLFVDQCGWLLPVRDGREIDQFDTPDTIHMALFERGVLCGTFRAVRSDRPYLAAEVFASLAVVSPYPHRADVWEISRFGVSTAADGRETARITYALMFWFARQVGACGLVAIADLAYERFLRSIGIRTRRYGPPQIIGTDRNGRSLRAVAGEIPLALQDSQRLSQLLVMLNRVEITDAADIFGPARVSA